MKTGFQIQSDFFDLITDSGIGEKISGAIYREGTRPRGSEKEDLCIVFTTADAEQIQEGVVTLNLYVPDIAPYDNGIRITDIARCEELETEMQSLMETLTASKTGGYLLSLKEAIHTQRDEDISQSFVVARISFKYFE